MSKVSLWRYNTHVVKNNIICSYVFLISMMKLVTSSLDVGNKQIFYSTLANYSSNRGNSSYCYTHTLQMYYRLSSSSIWSTYWSAISLLFDWKHLILSVSWCVRRLSAVFSFSPPAKENGQCNYNRDYDLDNAVCVRKSCTSTYLYWDDVWDSIHSEWWIRNWS